MSLAKKSRVDPDGNEPVFFTAELYFTDIDRTVVLEDLATTNDVSDDALLRSVRNEWLPFFQCFTFDVVCIERHPTERRVRVSFRENCVGVGKVSKKGCSTHGPFPCTCDFLFQHYHKLIAAHECVTQSPLGTPKISRVSSKDDPMNAPATEFVQIMGLPEEKRVELRHSFRRHTVPDNSPMGIAARRLALLETHGMCVVANEVSRYVALALTDARLPLSATGRVSVVPLTAADAARGVNTIVEAMTTENLFTSHAFPGMWMCAVCRDQWADSEATPQNCVVCSKMLCPLCIQKCNLCGHEACGYCLVTCSVGDALKISKCANCLASSP